MNTIIPMISSNLCSIQQYDKWRKVFNLSQIAHENMFVAQYPAGTWEFGVVSVVHDGYYQLGRFC